MNRAMLESHLELAKKHIALGLGHLARQRAIVAKFEAEGLDSSMARELLAQFEDAQAAHVADRDRILKELAAFKETDRFRASKTAGARPPGRSATWALGASAHHCADHLLQVALLEGLLQHRPVAIRLAQPRRLVAR